jgi:lysophospholipase L1-like esterase
MAGATYVNTVQRRTGYSILNQAIGGYPYKAESLIPISDFDPDLVLVMLGTNYYNSPKYDYEKEVSRFYEQLHVIYGDRPILSVTPFWRTTDDFDPERNAWCIEVIKSECSKYANITLLEGYKILPHIPDIYRDGCHPNAYGASLLADALVPALKNLK